MTNNEKALTLVELILVMILSAVLFLGVSQLIVSHARFSTTLQTKNIVSQEVVVIIEDISAKVHNSKYVDIGTPNTLSLYGISNALLGTYTWSGNSLSYIDSLNNSRTVSDKLTSLVLSNPVDSKTKTKLVKFTVGVQDPRFSNVGLKTGTTTAYCHVAGAAGDLVRLVKSSDFTDELGTYGTIQEAVDNVTGNYNFIQVSSNDKTPYNEKVTVTNKAITICGAYDYNNWNHDPYIGDTSYETIIDGSGLNLSGGLVEVNNTNPDQNITIKGFTIRNNYNGPGLFLSSDRGVITISDNLITGNNTLSATPFVGGLTFNISTSDRTMRTSRVYITRNTIKGNTGGMGGIGFYCDDVGNAYIYNNKITQNTNSGISFGRSSVYNAFISVANNEIVGNGGGATRGGGIDGSIGATSYADIKIMNNLITGNTASAGGGIYVFFYGNTYNNPDEYSISNNTISQNSASGDGSAIYFKSSSDDNLYIQNNTMQGNTLGNTVVWVRGSGLVNVRTLNGPRVNYNLLQQNTSGCPLYGVASLAQVGMVGNKVIGNNGGNNCSGIHIETQVNFGAGDAHVNHNLIVENTTTGNCSGLEIYLPSNTTKSAINAKSNTIARNIGGAGIYFRTDAGDISTPANVLYTISYANGLNGLNNFIYTGTNADKCIDITWSDVYGWDGQPANHNISTGSPPGVDPLFKGGTPYNYQLQDISPCKQTTYGGTPDGQMGAYWLGTTYAYEPGPQPLPVDDDTNTNYIMENRIGPNW